MTQTRPDESQYYARAERGLTASWRYLASLALGLALAALFGVLTATALVLTDRMPADVTRQLQSPTRPEVFFTSIGLMFACLLAGVALAARWVQRKRFADIVGAWSWRRFAGAALVWTGVLALATFIDFLIAPGAFRVTASAATPAMAGLSLLALAPQTFAEEFIFRGFLTQWLFLKLKRVDMAALASGAIFGAVHLPNGLPQAASATLFGVLAAVLAIRLGGIAFTSGLHLANNMFGAVLVVSASDVFRDLPGVITQNSPQLMWWDALASSAGLLLLTLFVLRPGGGGKRLPDDNGPSSWNGSTQPLGEVNIATQIKMLLIAVRDRVARAPQPHRNFGRCVSRGALR